jgi:Mn-dependent DtxR family transcriptional regulator
MTDDQLVRDFMRAVYEIGEQYRGRVGADQIMPHLDLDPKNLTTEDDHLYTSVAWRCEKWGYIESIADRYQAVRITEKGKEYAKRVMEL